MLTPYIIEMKGNSLDDGPGIRTVIFLKGCPLNCIWCHNPESKEMKAQLSYSRDDCIGCNLCVNECPNKALGPQNEFFIDRTRCIEDFQCTKVCPTKALKVVGYEPDREAILKKIISDKPFYDVSGGGVTLSGGEATMCTEWVGGLARDINEAGINILLETCGMFDFDKVREYLLPYVSNVYCDLKIYDRDKHKKYCGAYSDQILDNFKKMFELKDELGYDILPRTPLIPNISDTDENLEQLADFLVGIGCMKADLLPYNPTWYPKNHKLGLDIHEELKGLTSFQSREKIEHCRKIFTDKGITLV